MAGGAAVPPPPRQLEVRRFAAARADELCSLHDAVASRLDGRFQQPRSARSRTTGHLPSKKRCRRSRDDAKVREEADEDESETAPRQSRRVRRRRELAGNPAEGFSVAGDGARRLRTHLWHAKRFSMARRWGFVLPIGVQGRGRGSRAVLKWLKNGTVIHDASYFTPIKLDGAEDSLLSILKMVLRPQANVSSYYSWLDPGTDDHEFPQDDTTLKALRWPIGFVTTGFVHGSSGKDAVAVAFCEAKLLALLRQQQWAHEGFQGQEICVLVRNVRSATYRRALATIVLEQQQQEDLDFM